MSWNNEMCAWFRPGIFRHLYYTYSFFQAYALKRQEYHELYRTMG